MNTRLGAFQGLTALAKSYHDTSVPAQTAYSNIVNNADVKAANYSTDDIKKAMIEVGYVLPSNLDTGIGPAAIGYAVLLLAAIAALGYVTRKRRR